MNSLASHSKEEPMVYKTKGKGPKLLRIFAVVGEKHPPVGHGLKEACPV